ncbi:MAG: hypothetical protein R3C15_18995 [Thermoleophilia bacterium]
MLGTSPGGTGVLARSGQGTALRVEGRASFSTAGLAMVPAGEDRVRVRPGVAIGTGTIVLATVNCCAERVVGPLSRPISVWYVEQEPEDDAFWIVLTDRVTSDVRVGWFVIG